MRAIYFDGSKAVYREDLRIPQCSKGHSLIKVLLADICSTDKEILKGYRPDFRGIMGHEFVGEVTERTLSAGSSSESLTKAAGPAYTAGRVGRSTACPVRS